MKIKPEHYETLKNAMAAIDPAKVAAHRQALANDPRVKDLDKRLRWDCMYAAKVNTFVCDVLYNYMDDSHLDSALKAIVKELWL